MRFSLHMLIPFKRGPGDDRLPLGREHIAVGGVITLGLFLGGLLAWDVSLFVKTISREQRIAAPAAALITISAEEIDEVVRILEERRTKFTQVLQER